MRKYFSKFSIRFQMRVLLFSLLFSCIGIGLLINITIRNLLMQNTKDNIYNTTQKFNSEMSKLYDRVDSIFQLIQYDSGIENFFLVPYGESTYPLQNYFSPYLGANEDLVDIALSSDQIHWSSFYDAKTLNSMSTNTAVSRITSLGIFETSPHNIPGYANSTFLAFSKKIYGVLSPETFNQPIGNLILSIDPSTSSIILPPEENVPTFYMLADKNYNYYYFQPDKEYPTSVLSEINEILENNNFLVDNYFEFETKEYLISLTYSPSIQYYMISILDKESLYSNLKQTQSLILIIWMVVILFILLILWIIVNNMVKPMNELHQFMYSIRNGDRRKLKCTILLDGSLEIASLSKEFSDMLTELNLLNKQLFKTTSNLYEIEIEKQDAEIAHLRSQINPHFLYNTLETIKGIALENKVPQIATISNAMGKMFRYSIKGTSLVTLESELEIVKAYLEIQSIRFENRFQVVFSIDDWTKSITITKMLLQPLIENSIIHGLEKKLGSGILYIGSKIVENNLVITIQDDGVGMSLQTLYCLQQQLKETNLPKCVNNHIGVINVHRRITLLYGAEYGIQIDSEENIGTIVSLKLPLAD